MNDMILRTTLSASEQSTIYESKKERYGEEGIKIQPGYELSTLIKECDEKQVEKLKTIIDKLKETPSDTVREPIGWRISADTNDKLAELAAHLSVTKSDVVRGIVHIRAGELKTKKEDTGFSTAAWVVNNGAELPVRLIINEVMHVNSDTFVLSYSRTSLGRSDMKAFFDEQGYGIYESRYVPNKRGFMILYSKKRFELIAQVLGEQEGFLPILFRDRNTRREIVLIAVKVPYNTDVDATLKALDQLIIDLQQVRIKSAEIVVAGDFRSIPSYIKNNNLFGSLSICPTRFDTWSYVYEREWRNKLDHILISSGLQFVKSEYNWDFLGDQSYHGLTAEDYINRELYLPNHAVIYSQIKYK